MVRNAGPTLGSDAMAAVEYAALVQNVGVVLVLAHQGCGVLPAAAAARAAGVSGSRLFRWYVLRNSLSPAISLLAVQVGFLLFGVVVLEVTFDIHGLGSELVTAAVSKDLLVTQGVTLVFAVAVVAVNLLADLLQAAIDPRVQAS